MGRTAQLVTAGTGVPMADSSNPGGGGGVVSMYRYCEQGIDLLIRFGS